MRGERSRQLSASNEPHTRNPSAWSHTCVPSAQSSVHVSTPLLAVEPLLAVVPLPLTPPLPVAPLVPPEPLPLDDDDDDDDPVPDDATLPEDPPDATLPEDDDDELFSSPPPLGLGVQATRVITADADRMASSWRVGAPDGERVPQRRCPATTALRVLHVRCGGGV